MPRTHYQFQVLRIAIISIFAVFFILGCSNQAYRVKTSEIKDNSSAAEVEVIDSGPLADESSGDEIGPQIDHYGVEDVQRAQFLLWDWHGREYHRWHGRADYYPTRRPPSLDDYFYGNPIQGSPVPDPIVIPELCSYSAKRNVNCRVSDYAESTLIAVLMQGDEVNLLYLNPTLTHGKFDLLNGSQCWINLELMSGPSDPIKMCNVYVVDAPFPIADSTNNGVSSHVCSNYVDQASCIGAGCSWVDGGATGASYCQ